MQAEDPAAGKLYASALASPGLKQMRDKQAEFTPARRRRRSPNSELFKRGPVWVSVRIQLEGSDRDRRDGRGWNRQGRNAALRPEQGRELTLHFFFLSTLETLSRIAMYIRLFVSFASLECECIAR